MLDTTSQPKAEQLNPHNGVARSNIATFMMNAPFSLSFDQPNNATMQSLMADERQLDLDRAFAQFLPFYSFMASHGLVYLLPSATGLQDQTYVSNVGVYLPHLETPTIVLSNFRSAPRIGEEAVAEPFFKMLGYRVAQAPQYFEGEADLKHLKGNLYFGAYGMRTSRSALSWLEDTYNLQIVPIRITDPHAYHLDCVLYPISNEATMVCTDLITREEQIEIEKHTNIMDVSYGEAMAMATNCIRVGNQLAAQTNISLYKCGTDAYDYEIAKINKLEALCSALGFELKLFDLCEFRKSGAALSCFVMRLNGGLG